MTGRRTVLLVAVTPTFARQLARELMAAGSDVIVHVDPKKRRAATDTAPRKSPRRVAVVAPLNSAADAARLVRAAWRTAARQRLAAIDTVVIGGAPTGAGDGHTLMKLTAARWRAALGNALRLPFVVALHARLALATTGGGIVFLTERGSDTGRAVRRVAHAGRLTLTLALARACAPTVRVNAVTASDGASRRTLARAVRVMVVDSAAVSGQVVRV